VNERAVGIFRTFLTVVGILLLVIFGSRAAAQARNMKLAGATHKSVFAVGTDIMNVLGFGKTTHVVNFEPKPIYSHVPAKIQTAAPIASSTTDTTSSKQTAPQSTSTDATTNTNNGLHKATGTVNNTTSKTQQVVNNVTKNTSDDFTNLWP
jgi:hypothetical protein